MNALRKNSMLGMVVKMLPNFSNSGVNREEIVVALEPRIKPEIIERLRIRKGKRWNLSYEVARREIAQQEILKAIRRGRIVKLENGKYKIILGDAAADKATA